MNLSRFVTRSWYYFRIGYATYFTFLLGYATTFVTVYYLAIRNIPDLLTIFPHFLTFVAVGTVIGVPLSVLVGWLHIKRTPAWAAEMDISAEANPYNYKLLPGYWKDVFAPTFMELLRQNRTLLTSRNLLSADDQKRISDLEKKLQVLILGGYVGEPRRKWTEA